MKTPGSSATAGLCLRISLVPTRFLVMLGSLCMYPRGRRPQVGACGDTTCNSSVGLGGEYRAGINVRRWAVGARPSSACGDACDASAGPDLSLVGESVTFPRVFVAPV